MVLSMPLAACRAFLGFVSRARMNRNKLDGAKELKKMVFFSNIVVAPLLEDLKARSHRAETTKSTLPGGLHEVRITDSLVLCQRKLSNKHKPHCCCAMRK